MYHCHFRCRRAVRLTALEFGNVARTVITTSESHSALQLLLTKIKLDDPESP